VGAVAVEFDEGLGQLLVMQAGIGENLVEDIPVAPGLQQIPQILPVGRRDRLQVGEKGKWGGSREKPGTPGPGECPA